MVVKLSINDWIFRNNLYFLSLELEWVVHILELWQVQSLRLAGIQSTHSELMDIQPNFRILSLVFYIKVFAFIVKL